MFQQTSQANVPTFRRQHKQTYPHFIKQHKQTYPHFSTGTSKHTHISQTSLTSVPTFHKQHKQTYPHFTNSTSKRTHIPTNSMNKAARRKGEPGYISSLHPGPEADRLADGHTDRHHNRTKTQTHKFTNKHTNKQTRSKHTREHKLNTLTSCHYHRRHFIVHNICSRATPGGKAGRVANTSGVEGPAEAH